MTIKDTLSSTLLTFVTLLINLMCCSEPSRGTICYHELITRRPGEYTLVRLMDMCLKTKSKTTTTKYGAQVLLLHLISFYGMGLDHVYQHLKFVLRTPVPCPLSSPLSLLLC